MVRSAQLAYNTPMRISLAVSLAGLSSGDDAPWAGGPRQAIGWAAHARFRAVHLDASVLRARELDRSARRGLAAILRQHEIRPAGLDLWIPPHHFVNPAKLPRAADAALHAISLAADLARLCNSPHPVLSLELPHDANDARDAIAARADTLGVAVADHVWPYRPTHEPAIALGLDPATLIIAGADPAAEVTRHAQSLASARLSDASGAARVAPATPSGRLDLLAYVVSLVTTGYNGSVVLDLRGLPDQHDAAMQTQIAFEAALA